MLWVFKRRHNYRLESIAKIAHFHILTLPGGGGGGGGGGGHFDEKKITFQRLWGENGHNSINIRASALKSLAFDREPNFG